MEFNDRRPNKPATAWKSAWPEGHANHTVDATGAQQRMDKANAPKPKPGWKSAWPEGHANHTQEVTPAQQARNARRGK